MTPVFDLTRAEAVSELEGLLDLRPSQASPLEYATWAKAHQERVAQLEVWILTHPEPTPNPSEVVAPPLLPPSAPLLKDTPMPQVKTPQQKLDTMMVRLRAYIAEDKPRLASQLRSHIRAFCDREGIPCPVLPPNPGKGCGAPVPEDLRPSIPPSRSKDPVREAEEKLAEHLGLELKQVQAASAAATYGPPALNPIEDLMDEVDWMLKMPLACAANVTRGEMLRMCRLLIHAGYCFALTARDAAEGPGAHPQAVMDYGNPLGQGMRLVLQKASYFLKAIESHGAAGEVGVGIHGFGAQKSSEALPNPEEVRLADPRGSVLPGALLLKILDQPSGCRVEGRSLGEGVDLGHLVDEFLQDGQGFLGIVHRDSPFFSVSFERSSAQDPEVLS